MRCRVFLGMALCSLLSAASNSPFAIDGQGNVWLGGNSQTIATTPTAFQKTYNGSVCGTESLSPFVPPTTIQCSHAYLEKLDTTGKVLYATYLSGSSQDGVTALTTDAAGNVYATGYTYSSDFPVTSGAFQKTNAGPTKPFVLTALGAPFGPATVEPGGDAFVAKFAPDGSLVYSTLLGGTGSEIPTSIAVDASGSVNVGGLTNSSDFPVTTNASQIGTFFLARLNPIGSALSYAAYSAQSIFGFDLDSAGKLYVTGVSPAGTPFVSVIDPATGSQTPVFTSNDAGAGVAIAYSASRLLLATSPVPTSPGYIYPTLPTRLRGASSLLQLSLDGRVLSQTDIANSQFDSIRTDSGGNLYALGQGTGVIPTTPVQPLAEPCGSGPRSFVLVYAPDGTLSVSTYFRQGNDQLVVLAGIKKIVAYSNADLIPIDLVRQPAMTFACPRNLASNLEGPGIAAGEILVISGTGIGPDQAAIGVPNSEGHYPTTLGGVQVTIGGVAAPLLYAQANEIHAVAPFSLVSNPTIAIQYGSQNAPALDAGFSAVNPAIFEINGQGAIINQDGTVNSPSNPAALGSIVSVYATGTGYLSLRPPDGGITPIPPPFITTENTAHMTFAGVPGTTLWSGSAPTLIFGVTQINVQLPASLPPGTNLSAVPLVLQVFGQSSPPVSIAVK